MSVTSRCRSGISDCLSEELVEEEELPLVRGTFEPLSDSCGESDMEGLDLSLFEPQADSNFWCDSRVQAGTLFLLVDYSGKLHAIFKLKNSVYFFNIKKTKKNLA